MNSTQISSDHLQPTNGTQELSLLNCLGSPSFTGSVVVMMIDFTFGVPANGWSLWLISSGGWSLIESEIFTLNLVSMEMASTLFFMLSILNIFKLRSLSMELATDFLYGMIIAARPLFQCCICVERYLAVVHPVIFLKYKPLRYRVGCCGVVWFLVLVFGAINCIILSIYNNLGIFLPILSVDLFCSLSILRVLKKPGPGDGGKEKEGGNLQKKRAFRIVAIMLVMLLVNYVPTIIMAPMVHLFSEKENLCEIAPPLVFFSIMGSSVQALLFLRRAGKLPCLCAGPPLPPQGWEVAMSLCRPSSSSAGLGSCHVSVQVLLFLRRAGKLPCLCSGRVSGENN